ncbi:hypothetical protein GGR58DRAFT_522341 [Xylaria digitata]|nr:hypothetical protein GGR58DRAFT_522341 [Xylaria digitata]
MATRFSSGPKPFDLGDLQYVANCLSSEAAKAEDVLQDDALSGQNLTWSWLGFEPWEISKSTDIINRMSPVFTFVTVPNSITNPKDALRCLLCTLISEISDYVVNVPPEEMADSGTFGDEFVRKYINREYHQQASKELDSGSESEESDDIGVLIELLDALQHCDFQATYMTETDSGIEFVKHVYIVFVDEIKRILEQAGSGYWEDLREALENTLWEGLTISRGNDAPTSVELDLQDPRAAALLGTPNVEAIPRMLTKYVDAFGWKSTRTIQAVRPSHDNTYHICITLAPVETEPRPSAPPKSKYSVAKQRRLAKRTPTKIVY